MSGNYTLALPSRQSIVAAAKAIAPFVLRTPLVRLQHSGKRRIYLKLESLQPVGSFKIRCGTNALLARGCGKGAVVTTASAGNFAQGLGYAGATLGVQVTTLVPDTAAESKLSALERLGVRIVKLPYERWWETMERVDLMRDDPTFIHPVADTAVLAGNGTIGLEIIEDLPDVETIMVPFGGGGLSVGIAAAVHSHNSAITVYACESEAGTPVAAAFAADTPVRVPFNPRTFITGMGSSQVLRPMWPLIRSQLAGATCSTLQEVVRAVRKLLLEHHIVAEGAGASSVAAALAAADEGGPIVCVVSGGHLDPHHLKEIIDGAVPCQSRIADIPTQE
jgi:threonine dehydratase